MDQYYNLIVADSEYLRQADFVLQEIESMEYSFGSLMRVFTYIVDLGFTAENSSSNTMQNFMTIRDHAEKLVDKLPLLDKEIKSAMERYVAKMMRPTKGYMIDCGKTHSIAL